MALFSIIPDTDLIPEQAVAWALREFHTGLEPEHIHVTPVPRMPALDDPVWRWALVDGAPPVRDQEVTVYEGTEHRGHWTPCSSAPTETRSGLVVNTAHGMVVVGVHQGEDDGLTELIEQAQTHVAAVTNE